MSGCHCYIYSNVNALPTATLSGGATLCYGDSTQLQIHLTGAAPWSYQLSDGTNTTTYTTTASTASIWVKPDSTKTFMIPFVQDNNTCSNEGNGAAVVTVNYQTQTSTTIAACNSYYWL